MLFSIINSGPWYLDVKDPSRKNLFLMGFMETVSIPASNCLWVRSVHAMG